MGFEFTLRYRLAEDDSDQDAIVERLGAAGCTDTLVGIGRPGYLAIQFGREAENAEAALLSALADVRKVIPSAKLIEVTSDFENQELQS